VIDGIGQFLVALECIDQEDATVLVQSLRDQCGQGDAQDKVDDDRLLSMTRYLAGGLPVFVSHSEGTTAKRCGD